MTIAQIEKFYSMQYSGWKRDMYYSLVDKLDLPHNHKIKNMSCGQRSQVVLGLIFAQQPELMILDDYSMGLDAGYRRLFLDYLIDYVKDGTKTVFVTSHIIQDLEKLVDDVIFLDRGGDILQTSLNEFMSAFKQFRFKNNGPSDRVHKDHIIKNFDITESTVSLYSFEPEEAVLRHLNKNGIEVTALEQVPMSLEDAFIGLIGLSAYYSMVCYA